MGALSSIASLDAAIVAGEVVMTESLGVPSQVPHPNPNAWLLWADLSIREDKIEEYARKRFAAQPSWCREALSDKRAQLRREAEAMRAAWRRPQRELIERDIRRLERDIENAAMSAASHTDVAMHNRRRSAEIARLRAQLARDA